VALSNLLDLLGKHSFIKELVFHEMKVKSEEEAVILNEIVGGVHGVRRILFKKCRVKAELFNTMFSNFKQGYSVRDIVLKITVNEGFDFKLGYRALHKCVQEYPVQLLFSPVFHTKIKANQIRKSHFNAAEEWAAICEINQDKETKGELIWMKDRYLYE